MNIGHLASCSNLDFVILCCSSFATCECSCEFKSYLFSTKSDSKLAIFTDSVVFVVNCPRDNYVGDYCACQGKSNSCLFCNLVNKLEIFRFELNLFSGSSFRCYKVMESICRCGHEIECTVIYANKTCNISFISKVCCVQSNKSCCISS